MKKFTPYKIIHLDLSENFSPRPPVASENGFYTVLWWRDIALGDFYIEPSETFGENEYRLEIARAIIPALKFYSAKMGAENDWDKFFRSSEFNRWQPKLETFFSGENAKERPLTVPVSVIICTRERPESLRKCLAGLKKMTTQPEELIVVDNAPTDDRTKIVVDQFPGVKYLTEPRAGLDYARNTGISNAVCPIVAFTDDDVMVHSSWIYRVFETFQDETAAAMTGQVITNALDTESQLIFEKFWGFNRGYVDKDFDQNFFSSHAAPPVWQIGAGANMAFRKTVFDRVGCFHELLGAGAAGCNDDSEMWFRILAAGQTIRYNPRAIAFHEHRASLENLKKQLFQYTRGFAAAVLWQHRQMPRLGYRRFVYFYVPLHFVKLAVLGFPRYKHRYSTLWAQIKGFFSGLNFFYKRENRPYFSVKK